VKAAAHEHARLKTRSAPVDIFDVIEQSGIWLMFQPLNNLYGAYERVGDAAGIIINAKQPPSLQRFTAAHEYGHHILGHATSLDDEGHILPDGQMLSPRENAAQTFAAYFLMPLPLVDAVLQHHDLSTEPKRLTPQEAYLVSLDLGVSYAAALNHLVTLGKIDREVAAELRRYPPKGIKAQITGRARPRNDRADTWPLREEDTGRLLHPRLNDELVADLPEMPSSGYVWTVTEGAVAGQYGHLPPPNRVGEAALALVDDEFVTAVPREQGIRYGSGGTRRLVFKVLRSGRYHLRLVKRRPWLPAGTPAATWEIELNVAPPRTGATNRGLSERQKPLVALVRP
jgi:Zn-dependent peptidase ImmA (M78 family)/predicted secreted protein